MLKLSIFALLVAYAAFFTFAGVSDAQSTESSGGMLDSLSKTFPGSSKIMAGVTEMVKGIFNGTGGILNGVFVIVGEAFSIPIKAVKSLGSLFGGGKGGGGGDKAGPTTPAAR